MHMDRSQSRPQAPPHVQHGEVHELRHRPLRGRGPDLGAGEAAEQDVLPDLGSAGLVRVALYGFILGLLESCQVFRAASPGVEVRCLEEFQLPIVDFMTLYVRTRSQCLRGSF